MKEKKVEVPKVLCIYCHEELEHTGALIIGEKDSKVKIGETYCCPNRDCFDTPDEAEDYAKFHQLPFDDGDWSATVCASENFEGNYYLLTGDDTIYSGTYLENMDEVEE